MQRCTRTRELRAESDTRYMTEKHSRARPQFIDSCSLPVVSLFSGSGGLDIGFESAGFQTILAVDLSAAACRTFKTNHPLVQVVRADLSKTRAHYVTERLEELPDYVTPLGVIGGPPCQAFSLGNGYKRTNDPRARLSEKYAAILRELNKKFRLDFFVFENVLGLKHEKHRQAFAKFKRLFKRAGFDIFEAELNAADFGVAQTRRRVFIVGFNSRYKQTHFEFPSPNGGARRRTVKQAIGGLPRPTYFRRGLSWSQIRYHPNHWCMRPKSRKFSDGRLKAGRIRGRPFRVLDWYKPSWTVAYGNREVHVHPNGRRRLSVYEAMLLQGFPKKYHLVGNLSEQIRLISDAVPPPLAKALAQTIKKKLNDFRCAEKRS